MSRFLTYSIGLMAIMIVAAPAGAADPRSASMLANTCAGCHGTGGVSGGFDPSIAGLSKRYLLKTLRDYKTGVRPSTIMGRIARGYSDLELKAIAGYFAAQPWQAASAKTSPKKVAMGRKIHQAQCDACHADGGRASPGDTPRLAGQWPSYLYMQMRDQHDIDYQGPQPLIMRTRLQKLSAEELHALADFYASQK